MTSTALALMHGSQFQTDKFIEGKTHGHVGDRLVACVNMMTCSIVAVSSVHGDDGSWCTVDVFLCLV